MTCWREPSNLQSMYRSDPRVYSEIYEQSYSPRSTLCFLSGSRFTFNTLESVNKRLSDASRDSRLGINILLSEHYAVSSASAPRPVLCDMVDLAPRLLLRVLRAVDHRINQKLDAYANINLPKVAGTDPLLARRPTMRKPDEMELAAENADPLRNAVSLAGMPTPVGPRWC